MEVAAAEEDDRDQADVTFLGEPPPVHQARTTRPAVAGPASECTGRSPRFAP